MRLASLATLVLVGLVAADAVAADGAALYQANCAKCHGDDGNAQTPVGKAMKAVPLHAGQVTPEALIAHVRGSAKHQSVVGKLSDEAGEDEGREARETHGIPPVASGRRRAGSDCGR